MMRGVVEGGTGSRSELAWYLAAGKTGTAQKSMKKGGYSPDKVTASFVGIAPLANPEFCILVVLDEPTEITSGGGGAAPVFARIAGRVLPYCGIKERHLAAQDPLRTAPARRAAARVMPDFQNLGIAESLRVIAGLRHEANITYSLAGSGRVRRQTPAPGSPLAGTVKITLYFSE
jgi:membrane peptidoglycan carboxypeptidase